MVEIYNIFNTAKILNKPAKVMIGPNSGLAGIAYWINQNYQLSENEAFSKTSPLVTEMKQWIDGQFASGRVASLSVNELEKEIELLTNGRLRRL